MLGVGSVVLYERFNCHAMLKQGWESGKKTHKILSYSHMHKKRKGIYEDGEVWERGNRCPPPPLLSSLFIAIIQLGEFEVTVEMNQLINYIARNLTRLIGRFGQRGGLYIVSLKVDVARPPPLPDLIFSFFGFLTSLVMFLLFFFLYIYYFFS